MNSKRRHRNENYTEHVSILSFLIIQERHDIFWSTESIFFFPIFFPLGNNNYVTVFLSAHMEMVQDPAKGIWRYCSMVVVIFSITLCRITLHWVSKTTAKTSTTPWSLTYVCKTNWELLTLSALRLCILCLLKPLRWRMLIELWQTANVPQGYCPPFLTWRQALN